MTLTPRIARYDQVLLDLDGCLWVGETALEGAPEAVAALRDAGKAVAFLTNDVRHAPEEFVRKLWRLGFQAALSEVVTVGATIQYLLSERDGGAAFVVGAQALVEHVAEAGLRIVNRTEFATRADVVVVGVHERLSYEEIRIAAQAVRRGAELIGATRDATFPMPDGPWPASGAVLAAIETAAGRDADRIAGKPEPAMYAAARDRLGAGRCLAVGDRIEIDVVGAQRAGIDAALVLTGGVTHAEAHAADPPPALVAESLAALVLQ
ncbi:MAG TPA: HAD-IIA family hydrolase [Solirubrobacteraceae bacterium]|nr:HAD-IIA family hydrolase [Solirubrobacteraceae bacterium]